LDVIYDKNIPIAVTANQNLDQFTSSRLLENPFRRTISRLYELTSKENNL
jgi:cell division protein ZapE